MWNKIFKNAICLLFTLQIYIWLLCGLDVLASGWPDHGFVNKKTNGIFAKFCFTTIIVFIFNVDSMDCVSGQTDLWKNVQFILMFHDCRGCAKIAFDIFNCASHSAQQCNLVIANPSKFSLKMKIWSNGSEHSYQIQQTLCSKTRFTSWIEWIRTTIRKEQKNNSG